MNRVKVQQLQKEFNKIAKEHAKLIKEVDNLVEVANTEMLNLKAWGGSYEKYETLEMFKDLLVDAVYVGEDENA